MRAILIDPTTQTVTEAAYSGDFHDIYRLIDADCFDCVRIGDEHEHTIYVDDNGLINGKAGTAGMFRYDGDNPAYLAGKGLILATDDEGDSVAATMSVDEVRERVAFGIPGRVGGGAAVFAEAKLADNGHLILTGRQWPL